MEDETLVGELHLVNEALVEASLVEPIGVPLLRAKLASLTIRGAQRPPDRLVLSSYIERMEWAKLTEDAPAPNQETAWALINYWRPFDQRDPSVMHMRDLYPYSFSLLAVACGEE